MMQEFIEKYTVPKFRLKQVSHAIYKEIITSWDELSTWPKDLREKLKSEVPFSTLSVEKEVVSRKGNTVKVLFKRNKDEKFIETVLMRHKDGRNTVCVSCMIGCPVNCSFCATGKMGFGGNLDAREIIDQVLHFARYLKGATPPSPLSRGGRKTPLEGRSGGVAHDPDRITNVVFMGMGEPMLNLDNVEEAIEALTDPERFGMSQRRITVSTSGFVPQMKILIQNGFRGKLAISLHAPNQELREKLMPVAKKFRMGELMQVLDYYVTLTNKRVTYEYILIKDITDTPACAEELSHLLKERLHHVNLIPYNKILGAEYETSPEKNIDRFM